MAEARKQLDRRWLWLGAIVVLVLVFFSVRSFTREHLQVRVAQVSHEPLASTTSTNGRVEPENNQQLHSPIATTVKAIYVQPGDQVPAGKLLMMLDDMQARARLAAAESGVKSAQAALDAVKQNGTLEQRQTAAADLARNRIDRDQAQHDLQALIKLNATGAASAGEVDAARQRLAAAQANLDGSLASSTSRYSQPEVERAQAALSDAEASLIRRRSSRGANLGSCSYRGNGL